MPQDPLTINLFTVGDASDVSTWSNLPYFLSEAMLAHSVTVRRINLIPERRLMYWVYRRLHHKIDGLSKRLLDRPRPTDLFRDPLARKLINRQIRRAMTEHPAADFNFFFTYSYSSKPYSATPTVHLGDICYQHAMRDRGLPIRARDERAIANEKANLSGASLVLGTNKPCCDFLRQHYGVAGARKLLGGINLDWQAPDDVPEYLNGKWASRRVLFIGRGVHKRGVDLLVQAFERFNQGRAEPFGLTLVGINAGEIGALPSGVDCIGYLNKNDPAGLARYTALLESATMFVMPMREGPPPGVIKEALLTGTPVILSNIWHADSQVEHDHCGRLVDQIDARTFAKEMTRLVDDAARWQTLASNAITTAKKWSWYNTAGGLVEDLYRLRDGSQP